MLVASLGAMAQVDPGNENLTHSWTFDDGTAIDTVAGLNGILMGDAKIMNGSLQTLSLDSWIELPADSIAINEYEEVSVVTWFKSVPGGNTGFYMLAAFGDTPASIGVDYFFITPAREDDVSRAGISCGDASTPWASESYANGTEYDDGELHQMVSTLDSANITLYIDGQLQSSTPLDTNNSIAGISSNYAYLAKSVYNSDPTWRGEILEFNMYDKALSSDEILFLFNETDVTAGLRPVIVEAESGQLGSSFSVIPDGDISYITTTSNHINQNGPADTSRMATYQVTFNAPGYYYLYARLLVGPGSYDDDSFFYARGFGAKSDTASADWVFVNGLASAGFSDSSDIVYDPGTVGSEIWKWVNVSLNTYQSGEPDSFYVSIDSLTKTFQIGSREDGLEIDKFAFGKSTLFFTVGNLDNEEPGFTEIPEPPVVWEGPPLASNQPKFVGNVYSSPQIQNFEAYWNQVTPENAGKWGSVEGTRDNMNWSGSDAAYALAKDNDFPFHFHVLIWGAQQPGWIDDDTMSIEDQLAEITEWFEAVNARYPNIDYLEVVNEPLPGHNPPDGLNGRANYKEALGGDGETGWDWVITAFQMARDIFPAETKLMINDFGIISSTSSTAQYLSLIRLLQSEDLIDIIGVQGHAFTTTAPTVTMRRNLDSLATTGLPIQVTELDIDGPSDAIQLQDYQRIFPALYEHPGVEGITLWGWRPGLWRETAYLINNNGLERPALEWLHAYLDTVDVTVSIEDMNDLPIKFNLSNNYPNPFNPSTTINFALPKNSKVKLSVYNVLGQEVAVVLNQNVNAGNHEIKFNGSKLSSGLYFYKLVAGEYVSIKKMMLIK